MEPYNGVDFRAAALASGLLTREDLEEAEGQLRAAGAVRGPVPIGSLADKLVEIGRINRWQAEQLLAGRSRFNLGPYQIIDSIGQGGMGQVFRAEHTIMGRIVAVKVLPRHRSTPEAIASFQREIRAQAQLDHENLVRALDAGHDGNVHFLVTEYVPGTDLRRLVRRAGSLSTEAAASIVAQASRGLGHAHERGLIHRDVKPGNVLVTPDGRAKVSDLGLVSYFDAEEYDPQSGKIVGTADYLSPEQIMTPDRLTPASDIYSLGCTLYYAVTGKVPFPGGSPRDKARAHCHLQPIDPRRLNPELDEAFVDVIAEMMAKDTTQRLQTTDEVIARLAPWLPADRPALTAVGRAAASMPRPSSSRTRRSMTPPTTPNVGDTQPSFIGLSPEGDSTSQASQGTVPVAAGEEETLPMFDREEVPRRFEVMGLSPLVFALMALVAGSAIACLAAVLLGIL